MAAVSSADPLSDMEKGQAPPLSTPNSIAKPASPTWRSKSETLTPSSVVNGKALCERLRAALFSKSPSTAGPESIVKQLEKCPLGYPRLAAFLDSDENFMIYRRFGFLHARLLLRKQDELRLLEEELDEMDRRDSSGEDAQMLKCREDDEARTDQGQNSRASLLDKIEVALLKYDDILLHAQQLVQSHRPGGRDYNSVKNYMRNEKPLVEADAEFIYNKDDLVTLRPGRETAWLDIFVEHILKLFPRGPVQYLFCSKETAAKSENPDIRYFTKSRVERLVNVLILMAVLTLLVLPVYALYQISSALDAIGASTINAVCVGVLLVSTLLFCAALALFTKARRHEILAGGAAYCALLVVFIGNIGIQNIQSNSVSGVH